MKNYLVLGAVVLVAVLQVSAQANLAINSGDFAFQSLGSQFAMMGKTASTRADHFGTSDRKAVILFTTLTHDQELSQRSGAKVSVLVVGSCDGGNSVRSFYRFTMMGMPIKTMAVAVPNSEAEMRQWMDVSKPSVVYVCEEAMSASFLPAVAAEYKALTIGNQNVFSAEGAALAVGTRNRRPVLLLHHELARQAGARFDGLVLQLAQRDL